MAIFRFKCILKSQFRSTLVGRWVAAKNPPSSKIRYKKYLITRKMQVR